MNNRLIKSNDAGGGGACTNTVDNYNPFPDGGGVALYQLNGDATDVSGNYDGTATNVTYGTGVFGQAGIFNGSSSKITTSLTQTNTSAWSWSLWININAKPSSGLISQIISNINGSSPFAGVVLVIDSPNLGIVSNGSNIWTTNTINPSLSTWYHIAITYNGSGIITPYINGQSYGAISHTPSNGNTLTIGEGDISSYSSFNGSIDQVRIFNRALRPYEVEALYTEEYCTPTIVPSEHFNTVLYTGNGSTQSITGVGFAPDLVWIKPRSFADNHVLSDSVRGVNKSLASNTTSSENSLGITSFDSDGFSLPQWGNVTSNGNDFVAWNFKAGGSAVTNTDGTITSQVSANTEAGFSVVSWTGNGVSVSSVGHGLSDSPKLVIVKRRDTSGSWWQVYSFEIGYTQRLYLNSTAAAETSCYQGLCTWIDNPDSELIHIGNNADVNANNGTYIAYCFAEVEGFSNFGSYVGNGTTSGAKVVTGFEPAFIIIKSATGTRSWRMIDNKRSPENPATKDLRADASTAENDWEANGWGNILNFHTNGFEIIGSDTQVNANGETYIYMAFAADPTAVEPTLEDSFNTVTYTAQARPYPVTVGFTPDLIWVKSRTSSYNHGLFDTLRDNGRYLKSNTADAESSTSDTAKHTLTDTGFIWTETAGSFNSIGDYVAWNWKGAEIPAINSNGSIPSVVSANPAAGFSIVSWTGTTTTSDTIGHGLGEAPTIVLMKNRSSTSDWFFYTTQIDSSYDYLRFNSTNAKSNSGRNAPTSNVFDQSTMAGAIGSGDECIAYCFAEVAGFSKFGSYVGNGSNQYINLGFEPAFIMVKRTDNTGTWGMFDNKRGLAAPQPRLLANDSASENTGTTYWASTDSTGFTVQGSSIYGSGNFIYMAFANQF